MKQFRADLHIHSRFSRATSTRLSIPHLAAWSLIKGLSVVGTGDFTHPAWREELERDLVRDEKSGLYRLRTSLDDAAVQAEIPGFSRPGPSESGGERPEPLFLLQTEISSIYKRDGAVHKVHNLVFMPDFAGVDALSRKLSAIGNLASDGRPILGLDSERLLEIVLETDSRGVLIPAHIWTPWFSLFGSKSGFNALEDCFGSLSSHIFALETGLSSDPDMNRLWSKLDGYALISNSDAHSGENLGREANLFAGEPSYDGLFNGLRRAAARAKGDGNCEYRGTVEFFPEEGKYHLDGHRACDVVLDPQESKRLGDICPVCGKPLTVGVLHRVIDLADRSEPLYAENEAGFVSLIPLPEILGELLGTGPKSRKVQTRQAELVARFGPELDILHNVPEADLRRHWDGLGEAVSRMRQGKVIRQGGFDGEYGVVRVFEERERADFATGRIRAASLLGSAKPRAAKTKDAAPATPAPVVKKRGRPASKRPSLWDALGGMPEPPQIAQAVQTAQAAAPGLPPDTALSPSPAIPPLMPVPPIPADPAHFPYTGPQQRAIDAGPHPVLVIAGPGSGKTRTLVGRIVRLLNDPDPARRVPPAAILAVTFTRRAAAELRERLALALTLPTEMAEATEMAGTAQELPRADTLHALALSQWADSGGTPPAVLSEEASRAIFAKANAGEPPARLRQAWDRLALARERLEPLATLSGSMEEAATGQTTPLATLAARYAEYKKARNLADYTDLLEHWLKDLTEHWLKELADSSRPQSPWTHVLVDELQDLSPLQVAVARALAPATGRGFFGIGDPDQAIYGFRGAHPDVIGALAAAWPDMETITLNESHRSAPGILSSASALLGTASACGALASTRLEQAALHSFSAPDAGREAAWVAEQASRLIGATSHTLMDARAAAKRLAGEEDPTLSSPCSPGDLAVLVRMKSLIPPLRAALERRGVPCATPESEPFWNEPRVTLLLGLAGRRLGRPFGAQSVPDPASIPAHVWSGGPSMLLSRLEPTPPFDPLFRESAAFTALCKAYKEHGSWENLLDWVNLRQELDLVRAEAEQVQIMTLHASKGLEFRVVFLPALDEGILPYAGAEKLLGTEKKGGDEDALSSEAAELALAEERRLLYVGLTRAKEALFLSHAERRTLYGRELRLPPSRFLPDIERFFRHSRLVRHTQTTAKQMTLF